MNPRTVEQKEKHRLHERARYAKHRVEILGRIKERLSDPAVRERKRTANRLCFRRWYRDPQNKAKHISMVMGCRKRNPIPHSIRGRIQLALRAARITKDNSSIKYLGCSFVQYREYLESLFKDGMTWENYGFHGWHIDHVKPIARFDLAIESEREKAFHYRNTQPMWAAENFKKGWNRQ
jgi:hypothetical protein